MIIRCPWPTPALNPNKRCHWAIKAKQVKEYRAACNWLTRQQDGHRRSYGAGDILVSITFHPPDRRNRDRDNMISAFKSGQDGIAECMGVDDSRFIPTYRVGDPVKRGCVLVVFEGCQTMNVPLVGQVS